MQVIVAKYGYNELDIKKIKKKQYERQTYFDNKISLY